MDDFTTQPGGLAARPEGQRVLAAPGQSPFDAIRRVRPDGTGYWFARELMPLMAYPRWHRFEPVIDRAKAAAANVGDAEAVFTLVGKNPSDQGGRPRQDYELTRAAAYYVAMNGDPSKPEVADAQAYFVRQTRAAELAQQAAARPMTGAEVVLQMAQQLVEQETRMAAVEQVQAVTAAKVAAIEGRHDWFTALGYAKLHDHDTEHVYLSRVGKCASAIMREQGRQPQKRQDATYGAVNVYPVSVLERAFAEVAR